MGWIVALAIVAVIVTALFVWGWLSQKRLYGPDGHKQHPDIFVAAVHSKVKKRLREVGLDGLSEPEKICWSVVWLWRMVEIAGFEAYYQESYGECAIEAVDGLEVIGSRGHAEIVRRANGLFENNWPPRDMDERVEQLQRLGEDAQETLAGLDEEFRNCDDDLQVLMAEFIQAHRGEFSFLKA